MFLKNKSNNIIAYVNNSPIFYSQIADWSFASNSIEVINFSKDIKSLVHIFACLETKQSFVVFDDQWPISHKDHFLGLLKHVPNDFPVVLIATSGSTGQPKLVCHSMENIFKASEKAISQSSIRGGDSLLLSLSPSSMGGLLSIVKALLSGAILQLSSLHWSDALDAGSCTYLAMVPQQLDQLTKINNLDTFCFRSILIGGDAVSDALKNKCTALNLPTIYSYGSTESCGQLLFSRGGSMGYQLLENVVIETLDGRLLVKSDTLALGYLTEVGFQKLPYHDGFFLTNDIVELHPDFKFIGRTDFQFQSGSKLINPQFIESELIKSGLVESIIVCPKEDARFGLIPVAYVSKETNLNKLRHFSQTHLPVFLQPKSFKFFPDDIHPTDPNCRHQLL